LKLNSYDLGVDIELNDAINRIRFEHPEVRTVVVTSAKEKVFCSGANIFMLGVSSHAWKVNFCKFTNETRNGIEDSSAHSGLKFVAAVNGACAGGGYELALACDEIILVDDRSSAVSLPEVPLLGVLPGTGGLTRVTDKRKVRHDLADVFCTSVEGVRGQKAKDWRLVDQIAKPAAFAAAVQERALALAAQSDRPANAQGISLPPVDRRIEADRISYPFVDVQIDRTKRVVHLTVKAPSGKQPQTVAEIEAAGAAWYPLQMGRELDDAILELRTNEPDIGTWLVKTQGDAAAVLAMDATLVAHQNHWLVRETTGLLRRTFSRLDVSSRSLFALIEPGSCFAGTLLELALACDRSYHLALPDDEANAPRITVADTNFGLYPMATGQSRLQRRFYNEAPALEAVRAAAGKALDADAAFALGLVTSNPDDIDWADETRIAVEERVAMSPDALTGLEANLRFNGPENMFTRVFGRLTAWQNWIFQRPNAVGDKGALKVYGKGDKAAFDWNRV
jgi:benzoyl-CoA-dihydrodiol lyase